MRDNVTQYHYMKNWLEVIALPHDLPVNHRGSNKGPQDLQLDAVSTDTLIFERKHVCVNVRTFVSKLFNTPCILNRIRF